MRVTSCFQNPAVNFRRHAIRKAIERNHVRALGENRNAVDDESKTFARRSDLATQFDRTQPRFQRSVRGDVTPRPNSSRKAIAVLRSIAERIPQLGIGDVNRNADAIQPRLQWDALPYGRSGSARQLAIVDLDGRSRAAARLDFERRTEG